MEILVVGLNHKTAPIEVRERLTIPAHRAGDLLRELGERRIFDERLVLSTCNRTEIYGVTDHAAESARQAKRFLSDYSSMALENFEDKLYVLRQPESVTHLFSVASGLDSMVLGETEIIGQVKTAYEAALQDRQTGKVLNHLFQRSLKVAKDVRTHTEIGAGRVSVASVAVSLAEKIFGELAGVRVMVLGTGEMAEQVTRGIVSKGGTALIVSSRHHGRAEALAAALNGTAVRYEDYESGIGRVDILIASTLAPRVLIREAQVRAWMKARHERPLFVVDIAVPRNVETSVEQLDNVYLYNIDDLQGIAARNLEHREGQLQRCLGLIGAQTQHFMDWLRKEFGSPEALHPRV